MQHQTQHVTQQLAIQTATVPNEAPSIQRAMETIAHAFENDPAARWVWPDPDVYAAYMPAFIGAFAGAAFELGSAFEVAGYAGTALWLPPDAHPDDDALGALLEKSVPVDDQAAVYAVFEQMGGYHPAEPHWHLPMIGVRPGEQGKGYGSALLEAALAACDAQGSPAYLEATSPANVRLYERFGFEAVGWIRAGRSVVITPMVRAPRS